MQRIYLPGLYFALFLLLIVVGCGGGSNTASLDVSGQPDSVSKDSGSDQLGDDLEDGGTDDGDMLQEDVPKIPCVSISGQLIPQACPTSSFCHVDGTCHPSNKIGERCDDQARTGLPPNAACQVGFCKPGPWGQSFCTNLKETCGHPGEPIPAGGIACSNDSTRSRRCSALGEWETVQTCKHSSCNKQQGKIEFTCVSGQGCQSDKQCKSCFPGVFDLSKADCSNSCSSDTDCAQGADCKLGVCVKSDKKAVGEACNDDCQPGLFCIRGLTESGELLLDQNNKQVRVCCSEDCSGACRGCGTNGICGNVGKQKKDPLCPVRPPEGDDKYNACRQNGTCDGSGKCGLWPEGTSCSASVCTCDPANSKDNCKERPPSKCDAQANCIADATSVQCPVGLGCNVNGETCNFGACDSHAKCELKDLEGQLFCNSSNSCQVRLALYASCKNAGFNFQSAPFDDAVCKDGFACLKDNFGGNTEGRCGVVDQCIGLKGNSQLPVDSIRCNDAKTVPWRCSLNNNRAEWSKLGDCSTTISGCALYPQDPNSGINKGELCVAGAGCQKRPCEACPNDTRFDPNKNACIEKCSTDEECPSSFRCNVTSGKCVEAGKPGDSCQPDANAPNFRPCLGKYDDKPLYCTGNKDGALVCCYGNCDGPCKYCQTKVDGPKVYTCGNREASYQAKGCNQSGSTCGTHTGYCDGQGSCALPGNSVSCDSTCDPQTDKQQTIFCNSSGQCTHKGPEVTCKAKCKNNKVCNDEKCSQHSECPNGFFCGADKLCTPRILAGGRCEGKTVLGGFDSEACDQSGIIGLACAKNPWGGKGFCTQTGRCVITDTTTVAKGENYCSPETAKVFLCSDNGVWSSSDCDQNHFRECNPDGNTGFFKGYFDKNTCTKVDGCKLAQTCNTCPNNLRYYDSYQSGWSIPCFRFCHCQSSGIVSEFEIQSLCPADYVFKVQDANCWSGLWCGTDPADPNSGYQCRGKLGQGSRCSDTNNPSRQCADGTQCCSLSIDGSPSGDPYCSLCCSDSDCKDGGFCDIQSGSCKPKKSLKESCGRNDECSSGICCNSICSECCNSYAPDCSEGDNCCESGKPWCNSGICEDSKLGGQPCSCGNGETCDECKSKQCVDGLCNCTDDSHCASNQFCSGNNVCKPKRSPGTPCSRDGMCVSGDCCGDGYCKDTCCDDGDCAGGWCDNIAKNNYVQVNDGLSYTCKSKRSALAGCVQDGQCKIGECQNTVTLENRDGFYCTQCKTKSDCAGFCGQQKCDLECCNGVCTRLIDCTGPVSVCLGNTFRCGNKCCNRATHYCSKGGFCMPKLTGDKKVSCNLNDQWCHSGNCNRSDVVCE